MLATNNNYATPTFEGIRNAAKVIGSIKHFTLFDNKLDGTYHPLQLGSELWGNSLSDAQGLLTLPLIVSVVLDNETSCIVVAGSSNDNNFPVDFEIQTAFDTISVVDNIHLSYVVNLPTPSSAYTITITRISAAGTVAKLTRVFEAYFISSIANATPSSMEASVLADNKRFVKTHNIALSAEDNGMLTEIRTSTDNINLVSDTNSTLTNVYTVMRSNYRVTYGKTEVTYTDPILDNDVAFSYSGIAHGSNTGSVINGNTKVTRKLFSLYDNKLDGTYSPVDADEVGWWSGDVSKSDGTFDTPQSLSLTFYSKPVLSFTIYGDNVRNCFITDFDVTFTNEDNVPYIFSNLISTENIYTLDTGSLSRIVSVTITIRAVNKPGYPAIITELPIVSKVLYDSSRLISIDYLEEATYNDDFDLLGGISSNEVRIKFDNTDKSFNFNNTESIVAPYLKKNRKVIPWLGTDILGITDWYQLGIFWTTNWDVPYTSVTASLVALDTLGLIKQYKFYRHMVFTDKSIGYIVDYILNDAIEASVDFEYTISPSLYDVIIPYAWFPFDSYVAALNKIASCYPIDIYCDRKGAIVVNDRLLQAFTNAQDVWSNSTNVIDTNYPTLYASIPNTVDVSIKTLKTTVDSYILNITVPFTVSNETVKYTFGSTYYGDEIVNIACDEGITFTYEIYSWGIIINFSGTGTIESITVIATALAVQYSEILTKTNSEKLLIDGEISRTIESDFIQSKAHATMLADNALRVLSTSKYNADVTYRGNVALTINDTVNITDSLAPSHFHRVKRHELSWIGSLSGSATLIT